MLTLPTRIGETFGECPFTNEVLPEPQGEPLFAHAPASLQQQTGRQPTVAGRSREAGANGVVAVERAEGHAGKINGGT